MSRGKRRFPLYDPMGRLTGVTKDGSLIEQYQYNTNGARSYEMNALRGIPGRVLSYSTEDHLLTAGDVAYQYNVDGFLTARTRGGNTTTYNYSSRGELLNAALPDGRYIEYAYDPLGRRIVKKVNGIITEKYLWQGQTRLLAVYDGSDNLLMRFEYADSRVPLTATIGGSTYYLTYDQVGSLKAVADSFGNVVKRIEYDSFGNIITDTNPLFPIPIGFAGGQHDRDTNLVRFGYRDYAPEIGRWTAKDPILFAGGDADLYGYVQSDPINFSDPSGLIKWSAVGNGAIALFGGGVAVIGGTLASTTGVGAIGGVPAVLGGTAAAGWGVSQMIVGFLDNEIPFMGVTEAVIKGTTKPGLLQDELLGFNSLSGMLLTGRTTPTNAGKINSVIQSGNSIYKSGSTIVNAINGNNSNSSSCSR